MVADGDTLASVAQRYNVDQSALAAANELRPPYQLHAGLELWIPDPFTNAAAGGPTSARLRSRSRATDLPPITAAPRGNRKPITSETLPPVPGAREFPPVTVNRRWPAALPRRRPAAIAEVAAVRAGQPPPPRSEYAARRRCLLPPPTPPPARRQPLPPAGSCRPRRAAVRRAAAAPAKP